MTLSQPLPGGGKDTEKPGPGEATSERERKQEGTSSRVRKAGLEVGMGELEYRLPPTHGFPKRFGSSGISQDTNPEGCQSGGWRDS